MTTDDSVDFNHAYHDLNPVDEVLLRASIVKDYVQIPNIYLVTITAEGTPIVDSPGAGDRSHESGQLSGKHRKRNYGISV